MEIPNNFNYKISVPDLGDIVKYGTLKTASDLNCIRIATVEEVHYEDLTVTVRLLNKKTVGRNKDGTPHVRDYALIRAKICYCCPFITFPISKGDDCVLLFSDREIESWFINGDAQPVNHQRMHDLTDAFAIFGIRSLPKMIDVMQDALHLNYSKVIAENFHATNGTNGTFVSKDNKTITVDDGIVINMTGGGDDPSITADEIIDALGYTPSDSGAFHAVALHLAEAVSVNGSTGVNYSLANYLPDDDYYYYVWVLVYASGDAISGHTNNVTLSSSIFGSSSVCRSINRTNASTLSSGTTVIPIGTDRILNLNRSTNWYGTATLYLRGYQRIGKYN